MEVEHSRATGWVGWVLFGALMLVLLGSAHLSIGLLSVFEPAALAGTRADELLGLPLAVLAWGHLLLGAGALGTGVALIRGLRWARIVAVVAAVAAMLVNFVFAPVHPAWSTVAITLSGLVLYATAAHGGEVHDAYGR